MPRSATRPQPSSLGSKMSMRSLLFLALAGTLVSAQNSVRPTLVKAAQGKADLPSPLEIHVSGAGEQEANGVYVLINAGDALPTYRQQTGANEIWYNTGRTAWYMGHRGWAWCGSTYKCPTVASRFPPRNGWRMGQHGRWYCSHEGSCSIADCTRCVPTLEFVFAGENPLPVVTAVLRPAVQRATSFRNDAVANDVGFAQRQQQITDEVTERNQRDLRRTAAQEIETRKQLRQALLEKLQSDIDADRAEQDRMMLQNTLEQRLRYRNMLYSELDKAVRLGRAEVQCTVGAGQHAITYIAELSNDAGSAIHFNRRYQNLVSTDGRTVDCEDSFLLGSLQESTPSFKVENNTAYIAHREVYHPATPGSWNHYPNGCDSDSVWEAGSEAYTSRWSELVRNTERWNLAYDLEDGWTGTRSIGDNAVAKQVKFTIGGQDVWEIINPSITEDRRQEVTQSILQELEAIRGAIAPAAPTA